MRKINLLKMAMLGSFFAFTACDDEDMAPDYASLELNIQGLQNVGPDYAYEGWMMVDGSPVTTGIFMVDDNGNLSQSSFELDAAELERATTFILTIEPYPDSDPAPSDVHILAGDFSGNSAAITVDHGAALGTDFSTAMGSYILATPTDGGAMTNETSGVWWLDPTGSPDPSLDLPNLPAGWAYEGWAVIGGMPVSTGRFTSVSGMDDFNGYSSTVASGPPFPGEDFLMSAPNGLTFPTDLSGATVVISVEPVPDNSPLPFVLKPLVGSVPANAEVHSLLEMMNNSSATNPMGTVSR